MAISFTEEQQKVIDTRDCNILVSAAAGSGKTAVLVERIIQMVCDETHPVDIDRLLIVTFTNAAAAEMRERIGAGISAKLEERPDSEHIQRQATLLHNAQITTIDSFCLFLLRNHFHEVGLDPAFRIADQGEVKLMEQEVLGELLEDAFQEDGEAFRYCVEYFCPGGRERVLEGYILSLAGYAASFPWPDQWLEQCRENYAGETVEELEESAWGQYLTGYLKRMTAGCVEKLRRVQALCQMPDGPYMYGELVDQELEQLEGLSACEAWEDFERKLCALSFGRLSSKKDDSVSPGKRELGKKMRGEVKDTIQGLADQFFGTTLPLALRQHKACREPVDTLLDLVLEFRRRMQEKKREKKVIDFSDMEHLALDILLVREEEKVQPSLVAREYRQYFAEILIDEYQDSNLVQEYLLSAISGEEDGQFNRFMVGDVKQSIYKFRLARPELFLEKYHTYQPEGNCCRIDLSRNFRSRRQVVDAVNDVFSRLMSRTVGGIDYDGGAALRAGASYPEQEGCESELLLVEKPGSGEELDQKQAEALAVTGRIKELLAGFQVMDKGSGALRPARYSDMVILLRSVSGWDETFQEVLEGEGIPAHIPSRTGYFAATEVQELLQFLRVLDNPTQDIPLFGVMKSLFGGFSEEEIALVRSGRKEGSLYEALQAFAEIVEEDPASVQETDPHLAARIQAFLKKIEDYRALTVYMPIRELLTRLLMDSGYLDYVTALPAGGRRRANVEMLLTKASDFEKTSYYGLFHFIRYMEQLEKYDVDDGEAGLLDENADVVRIMSIHKSKGLEFPITFVAGLNKRFNMQDVNQSLVVDTDLGLAADYVDPDRRIRNKTLRRVTLGKKMREESLAEEMRVLYVAMTRAREKLILTACLEHARDKWNLAQEAGQKSLSYLDFVEAGSFLDFLLPIVAQTSIQMYLTGEDGRQIRKLGEQIGMAGRRAMLEAASLHGDPVALAALQQRLAAPYRYVALEGLYTKTTVSELKIAAMADRDEAAFHTFEAKEVQPYIPAFRRQEETVGGTVRGNAYHRVMELLDFGETVEKALEGMETGFPEDDTAYARRIRPDRLEEALTAFLEREVASRRLSQEYAGAVQVRRLVRFLTGRLGFRMWRASREKRLYREQPFVLGIAADRLGEQFPDTETVLIQGIIDVFFVEEDGLVLLDYKTDAVSSMEELWNRYETQLDYYREALERLYGMPVKEQILYSFHLGRF